MTKVNSEKSNCQKKLSKEVSIRNDVFFARVELGQCMRRLFLARRAMEYTMNYKPDFIQEHWVMVNEEIGSIDFELQKSGYTLDKVLRDFDNET